MIEVEIDEHAWFRFSIFPFNMVLILSIDIRKKSLAEIMVVGVVIDGELSWLAEILFFSLGDHVDSRGHWHVDLSDVGRDLKLELVFLLVIEFYIYKVLGYRDIIDFIHCLETYFSVF